VGKTNLYSILMIPEEKQSLGIYTELALNVMERATKH
jgi:hypothetical protein